MTSASDIPQSPINERLVLAAMMRDDGFRRQAIMDGLGGDHFHCYRPIYDAVTGLAREGAEIDLGAISAELERTGQIEAIGGYTTISTLWAEQTDARAWRQWVRALNAALVARIKLDGIQWAADAATPEAALEALQATAEEIRMVMSGPTRSKSAKEACALFWAELEALHKAGDLPGLSTGFPDMDAITGGMRRGQLWTALGESSRGKSVLLAQLACHNIKASKKVAIFSAEMTTEEVIGRIVSHRGGIDMGHITQPRTAGKGHLERIRTQVELFSQDSFWVNDSPGMSMAYIEGESRRLSDLNNGLDLVAVDYLQIIESERTKNQSREEVVANISKGLKRLAKVLDCPVISASQVNEDGKTRESKAIIHNSDVMIGIASDGLKMMKVRNGKRDEVLPYTLRGETQTFERFVAPPHAGESEAGDEKADRWSETHGKKRKQ